MSRIKHVAIFATLLTLALSTSALFAVVQDPASQPTDESAVAAVEADSQVEGAEVGKCGKDCSCGPECGCCDDVLCDACSGDAEPGTTASCQCGKDSACDDCHCGGEKCACPVKSGFMTALAKCPYLEKIVVSSFSYPLFLVFLITVLGYLLGKIEVKGVGLGTAGVFLVALVVGHFGYADSSLFHKIGLVTVDESALKSSMKLVENLGLLCFVTSVGFIAGPKFFLNLKRNAKSYALLAVVIIGSASLTCAAIILLTDFGAPMAVGILSGSLTTTPGFSAAKEALADEHLKDVVTIGHAVGYPFGVVGVVLFVQIVPKMLGVNIEEEQKKINASEEIVVERALPQKLLKLDPIGLGPFALAIILGILLGKISIPLPGGASFALGNTGGALIMGLILGHFGRLGPISMQISSEFLKSFREFGLVMFLIGAGVPGGGGFVEYVAKYGFILFVYGAIMELVPMILGFLVARYGVKLCLFNNLGSITGGMTSTPALGALINTAKTDDVAAAYAATYPVALVLVVLASQFLVTLL
ncbi:MAG: hypothetical protein IJU03_06905 [Thermoguttaceae bacterium]|nr:hypothetical protein [Thermoguttaceae bacterium]